MGVWEGGGGAHCLFVNLHMYVCTVYRLPMLQVCLYLTVYQVPSLQF